MFRFACPACAKVYKAEREKAGKEMTCKKCGIVVLIPEQPIREVIYGKPLPQQEEDEPIPPRAAPKKSQSKHKPQEHDESDASFDDHEPIPNNRIKPGKVTAIGGMLIGGGAWAVLNALACAVIFPLCCAWPGLWFAIVWAILAVIRGSELLGQRWYVTTPRTLVILQIVQAVNLDVVNVVMGIVGLVFLKEREIESSFGNRYS